MHAEIEPEDVDTLVLPQAIGVALRPRTTLGPQIQTPRLTAPLMGRPTAPPRVTVADLRLPADLARRLPRSNHLTGPRVHRYAGVRLV